jgi:hypothetical protein
MMATTNNEGGKYHGISLLGVSFTAFTIGLIIASRMNRKRLSTTPYPNCSNAELEPLPKLVPKQLPRPFNPRLHAFKALGIATGIVGVSALSVVGVTAWYLDVRNVSL